MANSLNFYAFYSSKIIIRRKNDADLEISKVFLFVFECGRVSSLLVDFEQLTPSPQGFDPLPTQSVPPLLYYFEICIFGDGP